MKNLIVILLLFVTMSPVMATTWQQYYNYPNILWDGNPVKYRAIGTHTNIDSFLVIEYNDHSQRYIKLQNLIGQPFSYIKELWLIDLDTNESATRYAIFYDINGAIIREIKPQNDVEIIWNPIVPD